jgi:hypothetical protein
MDHINGDLKAIPKVLRKKWIKILDQSQRPLLFGNSRDLFHCILTGLSSVEQEIIGVKIGFQPSACETSGSETLPVSKKGKKKIRPCRKII